jgi:hypothetical protein
MNGLTLESGIPIRSADLARTLVLEWRSIPTHFGTQSYSGTACRCLRLSPSSPYRAAICRLARSLHPNSNAGIRACNSTRLLRSIPLMQGENKERWLQLCELAATELDTR